MNESYISMNMQIINYLHSIGNSMLLGSRARWILGRFKILPSKGL